MRDGKGLVVYHFASSAFTKPNWDEFEKAVAGGWRSQGFHGPKHVFTVKKTDVKHPISDGLPAQFEHAIDELYQNSVMVPGSVVLATAYSDPKKPRGTGKDEPVIWVNQLRQGAGVRERAGPRHQGDGRPQVPELDAPGSDLGRHGQGRLSGRRHELPCPRRPRGLDRKSPGRSRSPAAAEIAGRDETHSVSTTARTRVKWRLVPRRTARL